MLLFIQEARSPHALVKQIWAEISQDLDRQDAENPQPQGVPPKGEAPMVEASASSIAVNIPVRRGVNVAALECALRAACHELSLSSPFEADVLWILRESVRFWSPYNIIVYVSSSAFVCTRFLVGVDI